MPILSTTFHVTITILQFSRHGLVWMCSIGPHLCGWRNSLQNTGGDTVPTERQMWSLPRSVELQRPVLWLTPQELTNSSHPESPALHEAPGTRSPRLAQLRPHPERWRLLRADEDCREIPDEIRGPEGPSEHPACRYKPLLPSRVEGCPPRCCSYLGATTNVCMSKLWAGSVGIVICY